MEIKLQSVAVIFIVKNSMRLVPYLVLKEIQSRGHRRILSRIGVTYKTGFGLDDLIYCTYYIHTVRDYR
jgi:hypothetical protein